MISVKRLGIAVFLGFFTLVNLHAAEIIDWEKIGNKDEIEVFKKEIPGSPVIAFKGQGVVDAPIERVVSVIVDTKRAPEWVDRMKEAKLIRKISDTEYVSYSHIGTPPIIMKDRDFVIFHKLEVDTKRNALTISMASVEEPTVPETDYVRGEIIESSYLLKPLNAKQTYVITEIHADPKGNVPKWIVNQFQKQWPYNTIQALRDQCKKEDVVENPGVKKLVSKLKKPA